MPPSRQFENYILTRVVDSSAGLTAHKDADFTPLNGNPDYTGRNVGQSLCDDGLSFSTPIGFPFQIDGITYDHFVASANGYLVLVDPTQGYFNPSEVLYGAPWQNGKINPTFTSKAVLLAPWFDDLRNIASTPTDLQASPFSYSGAKTARIAQGLEPRPDVLSATACGVKVLYDGRSAKGRRCIVRWNSLSNYADPSTVIKFEAVLYENGTIEFRYQSRASLALASSFEGGGQGNFEGATIGVFMPNGTNRFRDFAVGLGYRDGAREEYIYGGYAYTMGYTDSATPGNEDYPTTAPYTINLAPYEYWPGLNTGGSVFTFSPPLNRRKVLPRAAIKGRDGTLQLPTVARTGDDRLGIDPVMYDDRRAPVYKQTLTTAIEILNPGYALNGLEWLIPLVSNTGASNATTVNTVSYTATLSGDPSVLYQIPLRFRGVVEHKSYSGGSQPDAGNPLFRLGGTPSGTSWNIYSLIISNPPQTYYLNNGGDSDFHVYLIDYTETIPVYGGATVTLYADRQL